MSLISIGSTHFAMSTSGCICAVARVNLSRKVSPSTNQNVLCSGCIKLDQSGVLNGRLRSTFFPCHTFISHKSMKGLSFFVCFERVSWTSELYLWICPVARVKVSNSNTDIAPSNIPLTNLFLRCIACSIFHLVASHAAPERIYWSDITNPAIGRLLWNPLFSIFGFHTSFSLIPTTL